MPSRNARFAGLAAFAVLPAAVALKEHVIEEHVFSDELASDSFEMASKPLRQKLTNGGDVQYWGNMTVGDGPQRQHLRGLLDTGSFELLTFSKHCVGCFRAGKYDPGMSKSVKMGKRTQTHSYGSGSCTALDAFDTVSFDKSLVSRKQALWIAHFCSMPVLHEADFNSIVGVGPPGQPLVTAERRLGELQVTEKSYTSKGMAVPWDVAQEKSQVQDDVAAAKGRKDLLASLGVQTFSTCLGKKEGSPGWWIWNDKPRKSTPGVLEMPVAGNQTWSAKLGQLSMGKEVFGCEPSCGALVDTGTSLFAMPTPMYEKLEKLVSKSKGKCSDLRTFPDLQMNLGGQQLRFPPSSYIGSYYGEMNEEVQKYVRANKKSIGSDGIFGRKCQLLVMDLGNAQPTQLGPLMILGMPFFREYYTTFHLGKKRSDRAIFASKATRDCQPSAGEAVAEHSTSSDSDYAFIPRSVDASKLRVPHWVENLKDL